MTAYPPNWPFGRRIRPHSYGVILIDPPWLFKTRTPAGEKKSAQAKYQCLPIEKIKAFPVRQLAAENSVIIMWFTWPMLFQAMPLLPHWGFTYKTGGSWGKLSKTGKKLAFGTGYIQRGASEGYLIGTIGRPAINAKNRRNLHIDHFDDEDLDRLIWDALVQTEGGQFGTAPIREHSRKPSFVHEAAEALFDGPRIELFARERRPGWDRWGNQKSLFDWTPPSVAPRLVAAA